MMRFAIDPRGPFSLARAAGFLGAFPPLGHGGADEDGALRIAFLRDDGDGAAGAVLRQPAADGPVTVELAGEGEPGRAAAQVARILSLDADASAFPAALARDPVAADATADLAGLRPVLFPTPYEAAAWAVLSARQQLAQAAAIRARLVEEQGETVRVDGRELRTFPPPGNLLAGAPDRGWPGAGAAAPAARGRGGGAARRAGPGRPPRGARRTRRCAA